MANSNIPFPRDAYDDLADLFLTEPARRDEANREAPPLTFPREGERNPRASATGGSSNAASPRIAAIMRVNLPVVAGPWFEQAAAAIAGQSGPAVLLRRRGERTSVDLVAGREGQHAVAAAQTAPAESLPAAVRQLHRVVSHWIVEVQPLTESSAGDWSHLDEVILLTGADEAATVAAFTQVKAICNSTDAVPQLSLVVVGSEAATARRAADRIIQACAESLDCAVELRAIVQRMHPVPMRHLGRFAPSEALPQIVRSALDEAVTHETAARAARHLDPMPATQPTPPESTGTPRVALPPRIHAATPEPPIPQVIPRREPPPESPHHPDPIKPTTPTQSDHTPGPAATHSHAPGDTPTARPPAPASTPRNTLLSLLTELRPLEVQCPRAPTVEIGFDQHGRLHTLVEDGSDASLQQLWVACDWLREHHELLTRINPWLTRTETPAGSAIVVIPHLFTTQPRERRHLADGPLRVHILVRDPHAADRIVTALDLN